MYKTEVMWMGNRIITLEDIIPQNMRILFVGFNPAITSVDKGHYHQGILGKQFWNLLINWSILPHPKDNQYHDEMLMELGFGITDLIKRPTRSAEELTTEEKKYGSKILKELIDKTKPKIICSIYKKALEEIIGPNLFTNRWGYLSDIKIGNSKIFIMPFPYRSKDEIEKHMPSLRRLLIETDSNA